MKPPMTPEARDRQRRENLARNRAKTRLAELHPVDMAHLLEEARAEYGLGPRDVRYSTKYPTLSQPIDVSPTSPAAPRDLEPSPPGCGSGSRLVREQSNDGSQATSAPTPGHSLSAATTRPGLLVLRDGGEGLGPSPLVKANRGACSSVAAVG